MSCGARTCQNSSAMASRLNVTERWPPWHCLNDEQRSRLMRLTNAELDRRTIWTNEEALSVGPVGSADPHSVAMKEADRGDVTALRRLHPEIARFIYPPPMPGRGKRRPRGDPHKLTLANAAARDVYLIWQIWRERYPDDYDGRHHRRQEPTAERIAADRNNVDVRSVKHAVKYKRGMRSFAPNPI